MFSERISKKEGTDMNEFQNKLIISDKSYENGLFPKIPNYRKHGTAFILTGGSGDDIIIDERTTIKEIRKGKYTRIIEISTLPYMKEIHFDAPSKENAYSFKVYVKAVIQVVNPIVFYENCNIDVDGYFHNVFFLDVKKVTRKYSILDFEKMDEDLNHSLSVYNVEDQAIGFRYQVSVVSADVGEKAREYLERCEKQRLDAAVKRQVREEAKYVTDSYEEAIRAEVIEGKISESEAILLIDKYYRDKVSENTDYFLKLKENELISSSTAREYAESELKKIVGKNEGMQRDEYIESDDLKNPDLDEFYKEV